MRNYVQDGHTVTLTAPYDVASGAGFLVGALFAVALVATVSGAKVEGRTTGVVDLTAVSADTIDEGQLVYWDNTAKKVTETATNNKLIGVAVAAKGAGVTTCRVRLNGAFVA